MGEPARDADVLTWDEALAMFEAATPVEAVWPPQVRIDPNIRIRGGQTFADFGDADGPVHVGQHVHVYEPETGMAGHAVVSEVDDEKRLIVLQVDWASLIPVEV